MRDKVIITNVICAILILALLWHVMDIVNYQHLKIQQYEQKERRLSKEIDSLKQLTKEDKKAVVKHSDSLVEVSRALVKKITERKPITVQDTTYNAMCEYLNEYKFKE